MGVLWYDKEGKLIPGTELEVSDPRWIEAMGEVEKLLRDKEYKTVAQESTPKGGYWISTVWLGLDHDFNWGITRGLQDETNPHPIIFETMVFDHRPAKQEEYEIAGRKHKSSPTILQLRYHTAAEARKGHAKAVKRFTDIEALGRKDGA